MKRLAILITLVAGCHAKPCTTSSECGNGEVCADARCAALSCDSTWFAVDPSTGQCAPMPACGNKDEVRGWASCANPCVGLGENACIDDHRCQPSYTTEDPNAKACGGPGVEGGFPIDGGIGVPGCPSLVKIFAGCEPVAQPDDPCVGRGLDDCQSDSRCAAVPSSGCFCPATDMGTTCTCPTGPVCRMKTCNELDQKECAAHPECSSSTSGGPFPPPPFGGAVDLGVRPADFGGCYERGNQFGSCNGMDEYACLRHQGCDPIGTRCYCPPGASCSCSGGTFLLCEEANGVRHCGGDNDCHADERCSHDPECPTANGVSFRFAPASCDGVCVAKGCIGEGETACNADEHCDPLYVLECSPYGKGGVGFCGGGPQGPFGCGCEPTFVACLPEEGGCDTGKSVLIRDPAILDDPFWAFPRVLSAITGGADASVVADDWLTQIGQTLTVDGKTAAARGMAAQFFAQLPRRGDGKIDAAQIGFVPTSLSNRLDLADGSSCGEARITYALSTGVNDRRHRMTVIVELKQPDDGAGCHAIARTWLELSKLDSVQLDVALQQIYGALLDPATLKQVRTNEFLVGPSNGPPNGASAWELREWHLGADARLHDVLLPLAVDPMLANTPAFGQWVQANQAALRAGKIVFPAQYRVPTASEDGSRVTVALDPSLPPGDGPTLTSLVNKSSCAGCHTTETNSAFAHVGERFRGSGRAPISQFLELELKKRSQHLVAVARNIEQAILDVRPAH
jgi:hypothetical protein